METKELDELETLIQQVTHPKKKAFLENYPKFLITRDTARAIGVDDRTIRRWKSEDELFKSAISVLKKEIEQHSIELHEKNIDDVALNPQTPAQSRIFGSLVRLRADYPTKYREAVASRLDIGGDIRVIHYIPSPNYPQIEKPKEITEGKDATK